MGVIASYATIDEAHLAAARLRSAGFHIELRDENTLSTHWGYAFALGGIRLAVPDAEEDEARAILAETPPEAGILLCPVCGSGEITVRPLSPIGAVLLATAVPLPGMRQRADCGACAHSFELCLPAPE